MFTNDAKAHQVRSWKSLTFLLTATYFASYVTRINYAAVISAMENPAIGYTRVALASATTASFFSYGIGQVFSGYLGDRFNPKWMMAGGLLVSGGLNFLIPLCSAPWQMSVVWCVNGVAQSFIWPPVVRILMAHCGTEHYAMAVTRIGWGSSFGTIAVYLFAPLILTWYNWHGVFYISAAVGVLTGVVLIVLCPDVARTQTESISSDRPRFSLAGFFTPLMAGIVSVIALQGALRDGITSFLPSMIKESFHLGAALSILTGVALPIFGLVCLELSSLLYRKVFKSPVLCAAVMFGTGMLGAVGLIFAVGHSAWMSVVLASVLTGCMHGVNTMLTCMVPGAMRNRKNISTVSGVLNAFTYVGSSFSQYGIAALSQGAGWQLTCVIWALIAFIGTALSVLCIRPWRITQQGIEGDSRQDG